jgi:hypothetical protein
MTYKAPLAEQSFVLETIGDLPEFLSEIICAQ